MTERFVERDGEVPAVSTPAIACEGESPILVIHNPAAISVVQAIIPYALPNVLSSNSDQRVSWLKKLCDIRPAVLMRSAGRELSGFQSSDVVRLSVVVQISKSGFFGRIADRCDVFVVV